MASVSASASRVASASHVAGTPGSNTCFEKIHSQIWSTLESMEVFQKLPQKPHFQALQQLAEHEREGKAICYMVNFCELLKRTARQEFLNEPKAKTNNLLVTLFELEANGFDCGILRHRFALKEKVDKFQEQIEEVKAEFQTSIASLGRSDMNITSDRTKLVSTSSDTVSARHKRIAKRPQRFEGYLLDVDAPKKRNKVSVHAD